MSDHPSVVFLSAMRKLIWSPGPTPEEVGQAHAGILAMAGRRCPCGHDMDSDLRCLNGRIYGPCDSEHCDGPCTDTYGFCSADGCLCEEVDG